MIGRREFVTLPGGAGAATGRKSLADGVHRTQTREFLRGAHPAGDQSRLDQSRHGTLPYLVRVDRFQAASRKD
jgi:hypothetical protein